MTKGNDHGQKKSKIQKSNYIHKVKHNPNARESDERRLKRLQDLELKRLQNAVKKQEEMMRRYIAEEDKVVNITDPAYDLKGAAKAAKEFYPQPGWKEQCDEIDLIEMYAGKMWEHSEGRKLLENMLSYGVALHNLSKKTMDAIKIFKGILVHDPIDHLVRNLSSVICFFGINDIYKFCIIVCTPLSITLLYGSWES